ncbi:MAG: hypothetical protein WC978_00965 [bacterium]
MAITRSRPLQGREESKASNPSRFIADRTACTCPWWAEVTDSNRVSTGASCSPRRIWRILSICSTGSEERLAKVRFLTFPPSRYDSRSK